MEWKIEESACREEDIADLGNRYLIGNGYMGVRGTLEEYRKEQLAAVNLAGIYDKAGDGWREPLNAPNGLYAFVSYKGIDYTLPQREPQAHTRCLNFRRALFSRKTVWDTPDGALTIESERFAGIHNCHLLVQRLSVTAAFDGEVTLTAGIDGDVWDINGPHYAKITAQNEGDALTVSAVAGETGARVAVCEYTLAPEGCTAGVTCEQYLLTRQYTIAAKAGETYPFERFIAVYTTHDTEDPEAAANTCAKQAMQRGVAAELKEHIAAWERLWSMSEVLIEGDDAAMRALNYSLYHLHCIAPRHSKSMSIPARGLSGQTYKGAVFWDTEMFMLDFFLYTEPQTARTLLKYRIDSLEGALKKAKAYGLEGAFYAWESQEGGFDACSDYNVTDVFTGRPMRTFFKDKQIHISSAVAYAIMKYLRDTGDLSLLVEGGARVLVECARFYRSCMVKRVNQSRYELWDVIGPDEYHERINNNAYTNRMARFTLLAAIDAVKLLRTASEEAYQALSERYTLETELAAFEEAADKLFIPQPGAQTGIIEQFDGYFEMEETTPAELKTRLLHPKEYWGGAYGIASHTKVIKQADVVTMLTLFADEYSDEVRKNNWEYYEPRTEHGSSLSACMYALLACTFGRQELAYPYFIKTANADLAGGGKQWAGLVYIGGTHPAAAGGAWMTAIKGFAGFTTANGSVQVCPRLPDGWKRLSFKVCLRGEIYRVDIRDGQSTVTKL